MKNVKKIADEILKEHSYVEMIKQIKSDLNKLYDKMNIGLRFNSAGFNMYDNDNKIFIDIPLMSTSKSEGFSENLKNKSIDVVRKNLKKNNINRTKKDFKFERSMKGILSGSTYSIPK